MRAKARYTPLARSARLWTSRDSDPSSFWTEALGTPPSIYGERLVDVGGRVLRQFDPARSKLAAGIARGWTEPLPQAGERWLYLGAASGTTASHIADLLGPSGLLLAVEKSLRSFAGLLQTANAYPNLGPILGDARRPDAYADLVPPVDGVYADIAQADQVAIVLSNAREFLRTTGVLLLALKTSSMGRGLSPRAHLARTEEALQGPFDIEGSVGLDPFHRRHFLVGAYATKRIGREPVGPPPRISSSPRRATPSP